MSFPAIPPPSFLYARTVDELALLFTGSPAPPTVHVAAQEAPVSESTDVDEENGDGEGECEATTKDDSLPRVPAPPTPPSLDSPFIPPGSPLPSPDDPSAHAIHPSLRDPDALGPAHPLFTISQLGVDRRLIVNRKRQLKMYRVWMQGKFRRTETDALPLVIELDKGPP